MLLHFRSVSVEFLNFCDGHSSGLQQTKGKDGNDRLGHQSQRRCSQHEKQLKFEFRVGLIFVHWPLERIVDHR